MARKRLGRRERALVKSERRRLIYLQREKGTAHVFERETLKLVNGKITPATELVCIPMFPAAKRRTMWDHDGVPFARPKSRPWEYNWKLGRIRHKVAHPKP